MRSLQLQLFAIIVTLYSGTAAAERPRYVPPTPADASFSGSFDGMISENVQATGRFKSGKPAGLWTFTRFLNDRPIEIAKANYEEAVTGMYEVTRLTWTVKEGQIAHVVAPYGTFAIQSGVVKCVGAIPTATQLQVVSETMAEARAIAEVGPPSLSVWLPDAK